MLESRRQQRSRLRIERMLREINIRAIDLSLLRKLLDESKQILKEFLESHEPFVKATSGQRHQFTIMNIVPFLVYILDFISCSSVCEYMANVANLSKQEAVLARILVPAMVILIEVSIDVLRQYYSDNFPDKGGYRAISILFLCVAILLTFAMPGLFVGTQLASRYIDSTPLPSLIFYTILVSFGILTLAGHCIMLYSYMAGFEAKSYLFFLLMRRKLSRRHTHYEMSVQNMEQRLVSNFHSYCNMIDQHNKQFGDKLEHGPFTKVTREIINGLFGAEMIPPPCKRKDDDDDDGDGEGGSFSYEGSDETRHHDDPGRKSDSAKETSTDDDPIFSPTRTEWDPFKRGG